MSHERVPKPITDVYDAVHATWLENQAGQFDHPLTYVAYLQECHKDEEAYKELLMPLAWFIDPMDARRERPDSLPAGNAFFRGSIIGLAAVHKVGGKALLDEIVQMYDIFAEDNDLSLGKDQQTYITEILTKGEQGYERATAYHHLLSGLEDALATPGFEPCFKYGFGWMLQLADDVYYQDNLFALNELHNRFDGLDPTEALYSELLGDAEV